MKLMFLTDEQRKVATCYYCESKAKYLVNIHFTHSDDYAFCCVCGTCAITHVDKFMDLKEAKNE